jgi:hypothetical protein
MLCPLYLVIYLPALAAPTADYPVHNLSLAACLTPQI